MNECDPEKTERTLTPAARRALEEAEARRRAQDDVTKPTEKGGRKGPDPIRYGDWEKDGVVSDF